MKKNLNPHRSFSRAIKLLLVMKLLYFICVLQVFAASTYAQATKFPINVQNSSVENVFDQIEGMTEFYFFYQSDDLAEIGPVNVNYAEATIFDVLDGILADTDLSYKIIDRYIVIADKRKFHNDLSLRDNYRTENQQEKTVSGTVTDENDLPMAGVTIVIKGTSTGVATNINGKYSIEASRGDILVYSFMGYKTVEETVDDRDVINVKMQITIENLSEIVVTGYQSISKERSSGSFSVIDVEDIEKRPSIDLSSAMDGMFAGLRVYEEGGNTRFSVRGLGTMTQGISQPLIVVDGFAVEDGLESVNPNDVQSIHVLKDASAASIWGAKASNGVVVITTKKAKAGLHINVNSFVQVQEMMDLSKANPIAPSSDALEWETYLWENDKVFSSFSLSSNVDGNNNPVSFGITLLNLRDQGRISQAEFDQRWSELELTDYSKDVYEYLLRKPVNQNYDISISGASERNEFVFNTRYTDQMDNYQRNDYRSLLTNFRNTYAITDWLAANINIMSKFVQSTNNGASLSDIKSMSPYERLVDENGDYTVMVGNHYQEFVDSVAGVFPYNWDYNLLQELGSHDIKTNRNSIRFQTGLTFKIINGLTFETKFQYEQHKSENSSYYSEESYYVRDQLNKWVDYDEANRVVTKMYLPRGGMLNNSFSKINSYNFRNQLKFDRAFDLHHITAGLFTEITSTVAESYGAPTIYGYDPDKLTSEVPNVYFPLGSYWGGTNYQVSGMNSNLTYNNDRYFSVLGNFAYTFNSKYSFTSSFRIDASNLIVEDPKYRYSPFWSVGGNWKMDQEDFMDNVLFINRLNMRLSYGHTGNVVLSTAVVPLISVRGVYPLTGFPYGVIDDYGNPTLTWERTKITNFGLDFSMFGNSLFGSLDVYNKHGEDIVGAVDMPRITGTTRQEFNTAEILNRGFELALGTTLPISSDIRYTTTLNFSFNKSEVLSLRLLSYDYYSILHPHFEEGKPVDAIYSYTYLGMNSENVPVLQGIDDNTWTFNDIAPSTTDDREYMEYSGSLQPKVVIGWQNGISAFGFTLSALIDGEFGHVFRKPTFDYPILSNSKTSSTLHTDVGKVLDNTATEIPSMPSDDENNLDSWGNYAQYLNTTIEDASNIRLKEINLSYNLPSSIVSKIGFKNARAYIQVRNVGLLWTANKEGLDPMYIYNRGSFGSPAVTLVNTARSYTFGIAFGF